MTQRIIQRIREKIRLGQYDMTVHAMEEMAEDNLDILDVEHAILNGQIISSEKDDRRRTKYVIHGISVDKHTEVGVVGRLKETGRYLIITVYEIFD